MNEVFVGGIYQHFKGKDRLYKVIGIARDCKNPEKEIVIYKQIYNSNKFPFGTLWARTLEDFLGYKEFEDGTKVKRFELVE